MLWRVLFEVSTQKAQHFLFFPVHSISRSTAHSLSLARREPGQCWGWAGDPQLLPLPTPSSSAMLAISSLTDWHVLFSFPNGKSFHPSQKRYNKRPMFALLQSPLLCVQLLSRARMTITGTVCNLSQKRTGQQKANISSGKTENNIYLIKSQRWVDRTEADAPLNA